MIRRTLAATQAATYSIDLPTPPLDGPLVPMGTGFFVSADGWFVTAAHVVTKDDRKSPRDDINKARVRKESRPGEGKMGEICNYLQLELIEPTFDFALLKLDFGRNSNKRHLKGKSGFPHLVVSTRQLEEGEAVYAFGYPLSEPYMLGPEHAGGRLRPRTTSAVVSATMDVEVLASTPDYPKVYVLDKALNYGNSGGPIVAVNTGKVHALCSRFNPVKVPQGHLCDDQGHSFFVQVPSLYGVVSSLRNERILSQLRQRGIPLSDE